MHPTAFHRGWREVVLRPELTAAAGTLIVFAYFAITAHGEGFLTPAMTRNYLEVAADIGIIAAPVTLLLVAGQFDLTVGAMIAASQVIVAYLLVFVGLPLIAAIALTILIACLLGALNGYVVVRTGLPSFIVTLATALILRGTTQAMTRALTGGATIDRVEQSTVGDPLLVLFEGTIAGLPVSLYWWIGVTLVATWALTQTRFGNWTYATGGYIEAAIRNGIPVRRVKVLLYVAVAASASLVGILNVFAINQANANAAVGREFEVVTVSVIGGATLTGGYGSPVGAMIGSLMFGIVDQGFFFTDIPDQWYLAFLGAMLLIAVVVNNAIRSRAMKPARRS